MVSKEPSDYDRVTENEWEEYERGNRTKEIELWTREQAEKVYRRFGQDFEPYTHFVFINYYKISTKAGQMADYKASHDVGVFLVSIDTSDCRHVLCGFRSEADRANFLRTTDILIPRSSEPDD